MTKHVHFRRTVRERRRWLIGWSLGIIALVTLNIGFWPSFKDKAADMNEIVNNMPDSIKSLFGMGGGVDPFSPIGYLSSQIYAFMLPLLLLIAGIGVAASLAGDEEHGLLETSFALPVARRRLVIDRWLSVVTLTGTLSVVTFLVVLATARTVDLRVGTAALWWASVTVSLLAWAVSGLALVVGAWTGRRGAAITVAAVVAVVSYVITGLADAGIGFFESLEPASLFTHYDVLHTLVEGTPPVNALVLLAIAAGCPVLASWLIERRDLRAG